MADNSSTPIRVICGPTAAGKTSLATWFARLGDIGVVSADSRQVYRQFDVGTAKPTVRDMLAANYYGIDVLDPIQRASAAWWAEQADAWIDEIVASGRTPVVVGGTGLYLRALFGSLFEEPPLDTAARADLQKTLAPKSIDELRKWVAELDPPRAHLGRTQLIRAIEISLLTGRRLSDLHRENARPPRRRARYIIVDPGPKLATDIDDRARDMLGRWPAEVEHLIRHVPEDARAWNATGYQAVRGLVRGELTFDETVDRIVIETRQYAKRQRTWFRHQLAGEDVTRLGDVTTFPSAHPDWAERATAWWRGETA